MDRFSFFFGFYGLILGLGATEILSGFAGFVRNRAVKHIEARTALLALLTFIAICATWLDAWDSLRNVPLNFDGLWAPILIATFYYLAATVAFPKDEREYERLGDYYVERKRFVVAMLLAAETLVNFTFRDVLVDQFLHRPALFWLWYMPYNVMITGSFIGLLIARGRKANLALLGGLILLFLIPYWEHGMIDRAIVAAWHYPPLAN